MGSAGFSSCFPQLQEQVQAKALQELMQQMTDQCFNRCAKTSGGERMTSSEQGCLAMCMDRWVDRGKGAARTGGGAGTGSFVRFCGAGSKDADKYHGRFRLPATARVRPVLSCLAGSCEALPHSLTHSLRPSATAVRYMDTMGLVNKAMVSKSQR